MTSKGVIAGVAVIAIVLIAAGTYLLSNSGNGDITGTYVFQKGTYAQLSDGDAEFIPYPSDYDIVIETYDGKNFYGHWGSSAIIGAYDGKSLQVECVYDYDGKEYRSMGYGYVDGNELYYGANCIAKDGTVGAFTTIFAKKGTTAEASEFKGIVEKGQVFKAFEYVYSTGNGYIDLDDDKNETITVLDANNGIYVLRDEGYTSFEGGYSYVGLAVQGTSNTMVCIYEDGAVGYYDCTGDRIESSMDFYIDGAHFIESAKFSASGEPFEYSVPDLSGKRYEGTCYAMDNYGNASEHAVSISFGDHNGSLFYIDCTYDGDAYSLMADVTYDSDGKGYYLTCLDLYGLDPFGTIYDYHFGYISEDLKQYCEQGSEFAENGFYASFTSAMKLV